MKSHEEIFGSPTPEEYRVIHDIAVRAAKKYKDMGVQRKLMRIEKDIQACHAHCPLKLKELLEADNFNFMHDIGGINRHLDRETGELKDCFLPRFSAPETETV